MEENFIEDDVSTNDKKVNSNEDDFVNERIPPVDVALLDDLRDQLAARN